MDAKITKFYKEDALKYYLDDINYVRDQYNKGMFDLGNLDDFVYDLNEDALDYITELLSSINVDLSELISLRHRFFKVIQDKIVPITLDEMIRGVYQLNQYFDVEYTKAHKYVIIGGQEDYEIYDKRR